MKTNLTEYTGRDQDWPKNDMQILEEFCRAHNIVGFNCGNIPPLVALAMLKEKMGIKDEVLNNTYTPDSPYIKNNKVLLKG